MQCNAAGDESWEDNDDDKSTELILRKEIISLCERLEQACIQEADLTSSLELPRQLRKFRAQLQHLESGELSTSFSFATYSRRPQKPSHIWRGHGMSQYCDNGGVA